MVREGNVSQYLGVNIERLGRMILDFVCPHIQKVSSVCGSLVPAVPVVYLP